MGVGLGSGRAGLRGLPRPRPRLARQPADLAVGWLPVTEEAVRRDNRVNSFSRRSPHCGSPRTQRAHPRACVPQRRTASGSSCPGGGRHGSVGRRSGVGGRRLLRAGPRGGVGRGRGPAGLRLPSWAVGLRGPGAARTWARRAGRHDAWARGPPNGAFDERNFLTIVRSANPSRVNLVISPERSKTILHGSF